MGFFWVKVMDMILRKTGVSIQPERADMLTTEEKSKRLKDGSIEHVEGSIYREKEPTKKKVVRKKKVVTKQTYKTRDMKAENKDESDSED